MEPAAEPPVPAYNEAVSDLEAALAPVRELLERRAAERRNGTSDVDAIIKPLRDAVDALQAGRANGVAPERPGPDWELFDKNLADVREIAERLRTSAH